MNYESTEERIERLENQMAGLLKIIQEIVAMQRENNTLYPKLFAILADRDIADSKATLLGIKFVVENSPCIAQAARQGIIAAMDSALEKASVIPSMVEQLEKAKREIVLPEDLFGPR